MPISRRTSSRCVFLTSYSSHIFIYLFDASGSPVIDCTAASSASLYRVESCLTHHNLVLDGSYFAGGIRFAEPLVLLYPSLPSFSLSPQRLTMGVMTAEWNEGPQGEKHEVVRVSGTGSVVIKHGRRPKLGSSPGDGVLDVDVSLRHADMALGADECAGLCVLASAYLKNSGQPAAAGPEDMPTVAAKPAKALFREDFWYVNASSAAGKNGSGELDFDTLSDLLEQVNIN